MPQAPRGPRHFAVIGAGMAGIACARTLVQAGHSVTVFEKTVSPGGRMATRSSPFGSFDHGAQYFTVRDARFARALETVPGLCKPWSANAIRVLDAHGRVTEAPLPARESHWVAVPGMSDLVTQWAQPLAAACQLELKTRVTRIERDALDPAGWQLRTEAGEARHVYGGFDGVMLALPAPQAADLGPVAADLVEDRLDALLGVGEDQRAGGVDDVDALGAGVDHDPGLLGEHLRRSAVAEHEEADRLHVEVARGLEVLARHVGLGAVGGHADGVHAQVLGLVPIELDDEPAASLQGDAHDVATSLFGHLERAIARPRLHRGHVDPLPS